MEDVKNFIGICGKLDGIIKKDSYYIYKFSVPRTSGVEDRINVLVSFQLHDAHPEVRGTTPGTGVIASGHVRKKTRNIGDPTDVYMEAEHIGIVKHPHWQNGVRLEGMVANSPVARVTPKGRQIADVLLSIPDGTGKWNVRIPLICWGTNAGRVSVLEFGNTLEVCGRLQSRDYIKKHGDGALECRTVHEVSVSWLYF